MAYQIDRYNNSLLTSVEDGTIDQTTDLKFIGKNYAGYGEIQNENFLFLLENFSGATQPPKPLSGQIWFDAGSSKLKFYDGAKFRTTGGAEVSATTPTGLTTGDFWWDTVNEQLFAYNGVDFTLVGPQAAGSGITQMRSNTVTDDVGGSHNIIEAVVDDAIIYIISGSSFTLGTNSSIPGFSLIKKGLTLINTNTSGVTSGDYHYWGTSSDSLRLGGQLASEYILRSGASFTGGVNFDDAGIIIGDSNDLKIKIENDNQAVIENTVGNSNLIKFKANNGSGVLTHSISINATGIAAGAPSTFDIGTSGSKFSTIYADTFAGKATLSSAIELSAVTYNPSIGAANNSVALRDATGDITANIFQGKATSAQFADLAEVYKTDEEYPVGTIIAVGGEFEAKAAQIVDLPIGVISAEPAHLMNADAEGQAVGLKGRVPVRVRGAVSKGQAIYAGTDGVGSTIASIGLVGIALESSQDDEEKLIECVLKV